jgi:hypothetical protein
MTPLEVLGQWYDAHRRGDMEAARAVLVDDCLFELPGLELRGFDAFAAWSAERRAPRPGFAMEVVDTMPGEHHVAVLLAMTEGDSSWRQCAVYTVRDDRIASVWSSESPHPVGT